MNVDFMSNFPYSNQHELNLDWVLEVMRKAVECCKDVHSFEGRLNAIDQALKELRDYINNSAFVDKAVADKIQQMIDDGTLKAILGNSVMTWDVWHSDSIHLSAMARDRRLWETNDRHSWQPGCVYSPDGIYDEHAYVYQTATNAANNKPMLYTIKDNVIINELALPTAYGHCGSMSIKDKKIYSCNINKFLLVIDITDPAKPVIESGKTLTIDPVHIIGYDESRKFWLMANSAKNVYSVNDDFTVANFEFILDYDSRDTLQDYCLADSVIYRLAYSPNIINMFSAQNGALINTISIPRQMDFISTNEPEMIDVHGGRMYVGFQNLVGCVGSQEVEYVLFHGTPFDNAAKRDFPQSLGGTRSLSIDSKASPLNPGKNYKDIDLYSFHYIEDAQNAIKTMSGQAMIAFKSDYPHSFHVYTNTYINFGNHHTGAIKIDDSMVVRFANMGAFTGAPYLVNKIPCYIYVTGGSVFTLNNMNNLVAPDGGVVIQSQLSDISLTSAYDIHDIYMTGGSLKTVGKLVRNLYFLGVVVIAESMELKEASTIVCSPATTVHLTRLLINGNDRMNFADILGVKSPIPFVVKSQPNNNSGWWGVQDIYCTAVQPTAEQSVRVIKTDTPAVTSELYSFTITHDQATSPFQSISGDTYSLSMKSSIQPNWSAFVRPF